MTYRFDGYNWLVKLSKGDLLVESLTKLIRSEEIKGAWLSGLGGCTSVELGYYDLETKQYIFTKKTDLVEIISLQGNIAWQDNEPAIHIHGTFSDKNNQVSAGHVKELTVGGTCEILLRKWYEADGLTRSLDDETGLNLLNV